MENYCEFFNGVNLIFQDITLYEIVKPEYKVLLERLAAILDKLMRRYPKLGEDKIRENVSIKVLFQNLRLLANGLNVMIIENEHTNLNRKFSEHIADLFDQVDHLVERITIINRRSFILKNIEEQGKLNSELQKSIEAASTLSALESLYLPYHNIVFSIQSVYWILTKTYECI